MVMMTDMAATAGIDQPRDDIDSDLLHDFADELHALADRGVPIARPWIMRLLRRRLGIREQPARPAPEWVNIDDACAMSGLGRSSIYSRIVNRELRSRTVGRRRQVEVASLRRLGTPT